MFLRYRKIFFYIFWPLGFIYGVLMLIRLWLYQKKIIFNTQSFKDIFVIGVGNLSLGGAGKTPMIEKIIELLINKKKIAVLSRGYGRKTQGFLEVENYGDPKKTGDEPLQIKSKFPEIFCYVCEDRVVGIQKIQHQNPNIDTILLDDAFQHLAIKPALQILLTEYDLPFHRDFVIPSGNLREFAQQQKRADILIITKCPTFKEQEKEHLRQEIGWLDKTTFFTTHIVYQEIRHLFDLNLFNPKAIPEIILITGIAKTEHFEKYLRAKKYQIVQHFCFGDHYDFNENKLEQIKNYFQKYANKNTILLCTEKDAIKLRKFKTLYGLPIYFQIISTAFENPKEQERFEQKIEDFYDIFKNKHHE